MHRQQRGIMLKLKLVFLAPARESLPVLAYTISHENVYVSSI
jgi:hypothetical protein